MARCRSPTSVSARGLRPAATLADKKSGTPSLVRRVGWRPRSWSRWERKVTLRLLSLRFLCLPTFTCVCICRCNHGHFAPEREMRAPATRSRVKYRFCYRLLTTHVSRLRGVSLLRATPGNAFITLLRQELIWVSNHVICWAWHETRVLGMLYASSRIENHAEEILYGITRCRGDARTRLSLLEDVRQTVCAIVLLKFFPFCTCVCIFNYFTSHLHIDTKKISRSAAHVDCAHTSFMSNFSRTELFEVSLNCTN